MNAFFGLYLAAQFAVASEVKKDSLVLIECDSLLDNRYTYDHEYFRKDKGGISVSGGGGIVPVVKHCVRLVVPWSVSMDSVGMESWSFEFERKKSLSPKKKHVWKFMNKVIISDALIEFPVEESSEDCSDQKKKAP